jgi:TonB-like protein
VIRAKAAPTQNISPSLKTFSGTNSNALKALVVVNAVEVAPAPATAVPEGQLAGKFVVGPSAGGAGPGVPSSSSETSGAGSNAGHGTAAADGHSTIPGSGSEPTAAGKAGNGVSALPKADTGGGSGTTNGAGAGTGVTTGAGNGAGTGAVSSGAPGISISGGVPGRSRAGAANSSPGRPSYPLMIISGGASGGASRDLGFFGRHETVYSVSIPMAASGGGPDWTMQYALLDPAQAGAGLLVPPIAQKKTAATMKPLPVNVDAGPVFVSAVIDEKGKLQSIRSLRAHDTRSEAAIHALQQWEFLPAQLDGKPVSAKILMGISVQFQE